ncbi:MAG: hypothetical protein EOP04_30530, partial [Proteobacteria bacterium]
FQSLTREGVDPKRVIIQQVNPENKDTNGELTIAWSVDTFAGRTEAFVPNASSKFEGTTYTVYFDSASAVPKIPNETEFQSFLRAVGSSGKDAIAIEGSTDSSGNRIYNEALGQLRSLRAFEILVKTGLPAYRIETKNRTNDANGKQDDVTTKAAQRSVVFRWVVNTEIAKIAETKTEEAIAQPASNQVVADAPESAPAEPSQPTENRSDSSSQIDIFPYAGIIIPVGTLSTNAKSASNFGLGIAKVIDFGDQSEIRFGILGTAKSSLKAKKSDQDGPLDISYFGLRMDAVRDYGSMRAYFTGGLGVHRWDVRIQETPTDLVNTGSKNDLGANLGIGAEFSIGENLWIGPEANWHYVFGGFNVPYVTT